MPKFIITVTQTRVSLVDKEFDSYAKAEEFVNTLRDNCAEEEIVVRVRHEYDHKTIDFDIERIEDDD